MKFYFKIRDIHKLDKNVISALIFWVVKIKKNVHLLMIEEEAKSLHVLIKDFSTLRFPHIYAQSNPTSR